MLRVTPLVVAAAFALAGAAHGHEDDGELFGLHGKPHASTMSRPRLDPGSEAYPSTLDQGEDWTGNATNRVTREGVPAYQHDPDVGSEAYPAPR